MKRRNTVLLILLAVAILVAVYGTAVIRRGFSAADRPSSTSTAATSNTRPLYGL